MIDRLIEIEYDRKECAERTVTNSAEKYTWSSIRGAM